MNLFNLVFVIIKYFLCGNFITLKYYNLNLRTREVHNNFSIVMIKKKNFQFLNFMKYLLYRYNDKIDKIRLAFGE